MLRRLYNVQSEKKVFRVSLHCFRRSIAEDNVRDEYCYYCCASSDPFPNAYVKDAIPCNVLKKFETEGCFKILKLKCSNNQLYNGMDCWSLWKMGVSLTYNSLLTIVVVLDSVPPLSSFEGPLQFFLSSAVTITLVNSSTLNVHSSLTILTNVFLELRKVHTQYPCLSPQNG